MRNSLLCLALAGITLTGCSSSDEPDEPASSSTTSSSPEAEVVTAAEAERLVDELELTADDLPDGWLVDPAPVDGSGDPSDPESIQDCWVGRTVDFGDALATSVSSAIKNKSGLFTSSSVAVWKDAESADQVLDAMADEQLSACEASLLEKIDGVSDATFDVTEAATDARDRTVTIAGTAQRKGRTFTIDLTLVRSGPAVQLLASTGDEPAVASGLASLIDVTSRLHAAALD